jgi:predicted ATPase
MPSTALDYITVRGFKSIASIEKLPLRPINILIGSNGSGKSNFIGVFFLHAVREGRLRNYVAEAGGAEKVLHFGSKTTKEIEICLFYGGEAKLRQRLGFSPTNNDGLYQSTGVFDWEKNLGGSGSEGARPGDWRIYHLHDTSLSSPMRKTAKVE